MCVPEGLKVSFIGSEAIILSTVLTCLVCRCVDEINQGMDERNERHVWDMLLKAGWPIHQLFDLINFQFIDYLSFSLMSSSTSREHCVISRLHSFSPCASLSLSKSFTLRLSHYPSLSLSISLTLYLSPGHLSHYPSRSLSICLSPSLNLYLSHSISLSLYLSHFLSLPVSILFTLSLFLRVG